MAKAARAWGAVTAATIAVFGMTTAAGEEPSMLSPVAFDAVRLRDGFWLPRIETTRDKTLPHVFEMCERTHRIANFEVAAKQAQGGHEGYFFNDSDVYKAVEGAAYILKLYPDAKLEQQMDRLIATFAAAQQPDGYLDTYFQLAKPGERWTNDRFHELYCAGHLFEAGLAYEQATGKRTLLDVALKYANHIDSVFGPGKRLEAPEHPEIELALIKLWRRTNDERWLALASFFLDQRGRPRGRAPWGEYAQDYAPIREQTEVKGHAVRAMYLYSAVTDMAAIRHDAGYVTTLDRLWHDLTSRKMYITGGIGVSAETEGFTGGYDLPNEKSYAETCASIGLAFWAHRMNLLHRDARYFDVFERVVYNGVLSGVSLSGDRFLYVNPLASRGVDATKRGSGEEGESDSHRKPWFKCACCPPNILRFIPTIGGFMYAAESDALYVNLYAASRTEVALKSGQVTLAQETDYPWDGQVELTVETAAPATFELYVRIPGWCNGISVSVNGQPVPQMEIVRGYAKLSRQWKTGDVVAMDMPMPIMRVACDPRVKDNVGRLALQRGPLVYCLEQADNPGVFDLVIPRDAELTTEYRPNVLGGITVICGKAFHPASSPWGDELYRRARLGRPVTFTAVPYYEWGNRDRGDMEVWVPETPISPVPAPATTIPPSP